MSEERKKINYTVACVSEFAKRFNMSLSSAFNFLYRYKAIEFIKENYDIEHTLSWEDVIHDMRTICANNGGYVS